MVAADSDRIPRVPPYSGGTLEPTLVTRTGLSPTVVPLSSKIPVPHRSFIECSYNPGKSVNSPVWALPISIATTLGIDISFFSCRY